MRGDFLPGGIEILIREAFGILSLHQIQKRVDEFASLVPNEFSKLFPHFNRSSPDDNQRDPVISFPNRGAVTTGKEYPRCREQVEEQNEAA